MNEQILEKTLEEAEKVAEFGEKAMNKWVVGGVIGVVIAGGATIGYLTYKHFHKKETADGEKIVDVKAKEVNDEE